MIIVDGPDNVGKTTFIEKLAAALDFSVRSFGPEIKDWDKQKLIANIMAEQVVSETNIAAELLECSGDGLTEAPQDLIYDRYHMSNFVYDKIIRKRDHTTALDCRLLNKFLSMSRIAFTVLILPASMSEYRNNLSKSDRPQMYDIEQNVAVAECFKQHELYLGTNEVIMVEDYPASIIVKHIAAAYLNWRKTDEEREAETAVDETKQSATDPITGDS